MPPDAPPRRSVIFVAKALVALAVAGALGSVLRQHWPTVARTAAQLDAGWLLVAFVLSLGYRVANACGWPLVLGALRARLPLARGVRIWLVSETMRWLPGGVWGFSSRGYAAHQAGVPAATASLSLALELLLTIAAWTFVAALGVGSSGLLAEWLRRISLPSLALAAVVALGLLGGAVLLARRFPSHRFAEKARGFSGDLRRVLAARPRVSLLLAALALYVVLCALHGVAFYALLRGFTHAAPSPATVIGINATGWLIGFFAVCAPGGLGVREGGMAALLAPLVPLEVAIGSVVIWRFMQLAAEALWLAVFLLPDGVRHARTWLGQARTTQATMTTPIPPTEAPRDADHPPAAAPARGLFREFRGTLLLVGATAALGLFFTAAVILPAYREPTTRSYPSRLGYPALLRASGGALPVTTATAEVRTITDVVMGEGLVASEPVIVPIIPTDRIVAVHVVEGQRVRQGDLLIELDAAALQAKIANARLAVATAKAQLERVTIGSSYLLAQERPEKSGVNAEAAASELALRQETMRMHEDLARRGIISKKDLIGAKLTLTESERQLTVAQVELGMAEKGATQSRIIAQNAVEEAENTLGQRLRDLRDYEVRAPIDGVVEQVLVHAGEYNATIGKPGIALATGVWFEAHLDQAALNRVQPGDRAEIRLEALGGPTVAGRVQQIIPLVSYRVPGGSPTRPTSARSAEWPSTFRVRVALEPLKNLTLAPGMTGYARLTLGRETLAVPQTAVTSLTSGSGIVHVLADGRHTARPVRCGATDEGWTEILSGLSAGEQVIVEGQQFLQPGDRIAPQPAPLAQHQG